MSTVINIRRFKIRQELFDGNWETIDVVLARDSQHALRRWREANPTWTRAKLRAVQK